MTGDDPKRRKAESIVKALRKSGTGDGLARDLARCSADEIYGYLLKRGYIWAKRHNEWMRQIELPWETVMEKIQVEKIRIDGGTQSRAGMDMTTVDEYAEAMKAGANFPAVIVYYDGADYWLADGFHRTHAAKKAELVEINAEVRQGTRRDAVLHSVSANARHGLKRTNADKRRAIETLLRDDEWRLWADRKIAEMVSVDHKTVGAVRADLVQRGEIPILDNIKVQRGESEYTVTLNSYPPTPAAELDVEAARQIAVEVVTKIAADLPPGRSVWHLAGQTGDGIPYWIGSNAVEIDGEKLKVGKDQVAVQLSTVNGTGLYRFSAKKLLEWVSERDALLNDREVVKDLLTMIRREYHYIDDKVGRRMVKYGLAITSGNRHIVTGSGKEFAQWCIDSKPVLRVEQEIYREHPKANLNVMAGEEFLKNLYDEQATGRTINGWVRESVFYQNSLSWLPFFAARNYVTREERDAISIWNHDRKAMVKFVAITPEGCALIEREVLPLPDELPHWKWHLQADAFVDPNGTFNVKVGDTVAWRNGDTAIVLELEEYPTVRLKDVRHGNEIKAVDFNLKVIEPTQPVKTVKEESEEIAEIAKAAGLTQTCVSFDVQSGQYLLYASWDAVDVSKLVGKYEAVDGRAISRDVRHWINERLANSHLRSAAPGTTIAVGDANGKPLRIGSKVITRAGQKGEITAINGGLCRVQTAHMISQHRPATLTKVEDPTPALPKHGEGEGHGDEKRHNDAQFMAAWYAMQSMNNQLEGVTGADKVFAQHLMSMMAMARDALADRLGIELREEAAV